MKVAIRCDASNAIGTGHVMRCATLADQLTTHSAEVTFICRNHPGHLNDYIKELGYAICELPSPDSDAANFGGTEYARWLAVPDMIDASESLDALRSLPGGIDWLIVDHYGLDARWEQEMRATVKAVMVIDDLANRCHNCDLLLDQSYVEDYEHRYRSLVPDSCRVYLGPQYALLRPEFLQARHKLRRRGGHVERILVFLGGVDPSNQTRKAIDAIIALERDDIQLDVVIGSRNPHKDEIRKVCSRHSQFVVHENAVQMAELMSQADLAVGAGGTTTWERCFLGLPTITILIADNQRDMIEALAERGATINAGWYSDLSVAALNAQLVELLRDQGSLTKMQTASLEIMGERDTGVCHPLVNAMTEIVHATA
ncbi:MAG: UDP-2,4-diacetamido-2,4,6-trideoxy-beta-L-altropyranose hydrolase [candidate division Zixibacteria bacterium]|nr:UDP-2,4-diacetamido-2,4,6-trideoxy-beta-L-altropyranose hydrolase [candidate division Zixibacteria bacterium]MDH3938048.1 UDP-2,4-diacetamido-2,4,6-trideoxy-beta-L-altropyranose hydrolase [candidate division Zixibacteria bacterium]MDH4033937.1 UDP-2,4-diacetamido-2,4,6-trideoxy-beta-L-altropyranose hydrolase [candidate division Zixibacteria bacterium]